MYNLLTPNDFPIDAKNIILTNIIKKGVRRIEPTTDRTTINAAMFATKHSRNRKLLTGANIVFREKNRRHT